MEARLGEINASLAKGTQREDNFGVCEIVQGFGEISRTNSTTLEILQ